MKYRQIYIIFVFSQQMLCYRLSIGKYLRESKCRSQNYRLAELAKLVVAMI